MNISPSPLCSAFPAGRKLRRSRTMLICLSHGEGTGSGPRPSPCSCPTPLRGLTRDAWAPSPAAARVGAKPLRWGCRRQLLRAPTRCHSRPTSCPRQAPTAAREGTQGWGHPVLRAPGDACFGGCAGCRRWKQSQRHCSRGLRKINLASPPVL